MLINQVFKMGDYRLEHKNNAESISVYNAKMIIK